MSPSPATKRNRPNVLLVTTDQQRYDTVGRGAPNFLRTPHTDFLQRQGIEFTRAYSSCPICVASRTSIMTGQDVFGHGMYGNGSTSDVMGAENTLPACLRDAGYYTACIGKTHFKPEHTRHGFGELHRFNEYRRERRRAGKNVDQRHGIGNTDTHPAIDPVPQDETRTAWAVDRSIDYIRDRDRAQPFFLWTSFFYPHPPFSPPEEFFGMYRDAGAPIPEPVCGDWADDPPKAIRNRLDGTGYLSFDDDWTIRDMRAAYYGLCTHIEYQLGRLFGAMEDEGVLDDTLIVFTSDHGEYLGDHGLTSKVLFHDQSARVPFLLRLPTTWDDRMAGTATDTLVQLDDVLPTIVDAAGADRPPGTTGRDLVALASGDAPERDYVEGIAPDTRAYAGICDGRWKYIWYPEGSREQLFDLDSDPDETTNLADDPEYDEQRNHLREELRNRHVDRGRFGFDDRIRFAADGELIGFPEGGPAPDDWIVDGKTADVFSREHFGPNL